jgi:signal peptidase I
MRTDAAADVWRNLFMIQPSLPNEGSAKASRHKSVVREYLEAFGIALGIAMVMRASLVQAYVVPSGSMLPTIQIGDHIFVNKIRYGLRVPDSIFGLRVPALPLGQYLWRFEPVQRGDVIVLTSPVDPGMDLLKRVIGVAGDAVLVKNGKVFLNGHAMDDPHAHFEVSDGDRSPSRVRDPRDNFGILDVHTGEVVGPVIVPPGKLFLMGDNRDNSYDSRYWGFADVNAVEGRAILVYWSWDSTANATVPPVRWGRLGHIIY